MKAASVHSRSVPYYRSVFVAWWLLESLFPPLEGNHANKLYSLGVKVRQTLLIGDHLLISYLL